jgi:DNA-binding transcriptional ArsR family regulator
MSFVATDERLRALAHPTRRALLRLVRDTALPVGELADAVGASQPATSQHLAVLREAGLVTAVAEGRRRLYLADHAALADARRFFDEYWSTAIDRLAATAEQHAASRRAAS